jgi:hypothetical protein
MSDKESQRYFLRDEMHEIRNAIEDERMNNQSSTKKFEPVGSGEVVNQIKNQRMCGKWSRINIDSN